MALGIGDNFNYQGRKPNFDRDSFATLAEMKAYPETSIDEGHVSYCAETGLRYIYSSSNLNDSITGKWLPYYAAPPLHDGGGMKITQLSTFIGLSVRLGSGLVFTDGSSTNAVKINLTSAVNTHNSGLTWDSDMDRLTLNVGTGLELGGGRIKAALKHPTGNDVSGGLRYSGDERIELCLATGTAYSDVGKRLANLMCGFGDTQWNQGPVLGINVGPGLAVGASDAIGLQLGTSSGLTVDNRGVRINIGQGVHAQYKSRLFGGLYIDASKNTVGVLLGTSLTLGEIGQVSINPNIFEGGLQMDPDREAISIKTSTGLRVTDSGISVMLGTSVDFFRETGGIEVRMADETLEIKREGLRVRVCSGLTPTTGGIAIEPGKGIDVDHDKVDVRTGTGLDIDAENKIIINEEYIKQLVGENTNNPGGGGITVDSELSETSENPVQNKVLYEVLSDLSGNVISAVTGLQNITDEEGNVKVGAGIHGGQHGPYLDFTETATNEANGFMSKEDKAKLDAFSVAGIRILTKDEYANADKTVNTVYFLKG